MSHTRRRPDGAGCRSVAIPKRRNCVDYIAAAVTCPVALLALTQELPAKGATLREMRRISAQEHSLSRVAVVAARADGTIWISQPEDGDIVGLRPGERQLFHLGRAGEGPGDFRVVDQLWPMGDSLWVHDGELQRGTLFDQNGRVISTVSIHAPDKLLNRRLMAAGPGGRAWWRSWAGEEASYRIHAARHDGSGAREVDREGPTGCSVVRRDGDAMRGVAIPFCHRQFAAFSPNAAFRALAKPLYRGGDSAGVHLVVIKWNGDTVVDRTVWMRASPVPTTAKDSAIRRLERYKGIAGSLAQKILQDNLIPTRLSPVVDVDVSIRGEVVLTVRRGRSGEMWAHYFDGRGQRLFGFALGPRQEVRWVEGRRLVMVEEDADGLQDVVLYAIEAGATN